MNSKYIKIILTFLISITLTDCNTINKSNIITLYHASNGFVKDIENNVVLTYGMGFVKDKNWNIVYTYNLGFIKDVNGNLKYTYSIGFIKDRKGNVICTYPYPN